MLHKPERVSLILILQDGVASTRRNRIRTRLQELGLEVTHVTGGERSYLEVTGDDLALRTLCPEEWEGVEAVVPLSPDYPHASWGGGRGTLVTPTLVTVGTESPVSIGAGSFAVFAGPCAIENRERSLSIAAAVRESGAQIFRGGAFKPRTSPYAFQGLEDQALEILAEVRETTGMPVVTEVLDPRHIERVCLHADMLQVGSRNMQNYALLKELGQVRKPVLLKRGFAATVDEWLLAAEYLLSSGNSQVVLCERGIRSAAGGQDVILDLAAIPEVRQRSHLPVMVDPSHSSVRSFRVAPLARAAVAAGADGLLIEVHDAPAEALSDGRQALETQEFTELMRQVTAIRAALDPTGATGARIDDSLSASMRKD